MIPFEHTLLCALTLSVLYRCLVLLYHGLCSSGKGCCSGTVPMVHQVAGHHTRKKKVYNKKKTSFWFFLTNFKIFTSHLSFSENIKLEIFHLYDVYTKKGNVNMDRIVLVSLELCDCGIQLENICPESR